MVIPQAVEGQEEVNERQFIARGSLYFKASAFQLEPQSRELSTV
jgi:hypothetical protein